MINHTHDQRCGENMGVLSPGILIAGLKRMLGLSERDYVGQSTLWFNRFSPNIGTWTKQRGLGWLRPQPCEAVFRPEFQKPNAGATAASSPCRVVVPKFSSSGNGSELPELPNFSTTTLQSLGRRLVPLELNSKNEVQATQDSVMESA